MIDAKDLQILSILQDNARTPNAEIARTLGMAPSAVLERVRKLEERGVLRGYEARIDPGALGLGLVAFVVVRGEERVASEETGRRLAALPEVQEVHHVAGEDCYLMKVRTTGTADLARFLRDRLGAIPAVRSTRTTIVLGTLKETGALPLPERAGEDEDA